MGKKDASGKILVIVESPTKAKTIRKFLGKDYVVESCMGHVRDLPQSAKDIPEKVKKQPWATLGVDVDHDFEPIYCVPKNKIKIVRELKEKLAGARELILATDEDREGESISWHLLETLKPKVPYKRMVFHEITKEAILKALVESRDIDFNLVRAQEARRVLDRLVGYTLSPLIWKKVAYGLSAGRVQSVAVRLIVEREHERVRFRKSVYSGLLAECERDEIVFESRLITYQGKRIATGKDFDAATGKLLPERVKEVAHLDDDKAQAILNSLPKGAWTTSEVEEKPISRKPPAPFITSTLQQEANRKLGLSAREAMQVAQSLYEQGFISYMRTDSTFLSKEALQAARSRIQKLYGKDYLPDEPRLYEGKKAKGAQEAHEAIRPAGTEFLTPEETGLKGPQLKLYELIWMRTMASQMVNARQKQVSVRFQVGEALFASSGMSIEFPGFLRAYVEGSDDEAGALEEKEVRLPLLKKGDKVSCSKLDVTSHETKPPARYTDASLVQTMEREGIGRPSTYAAVISTIIDRGYVKRAANALTPTFTAMVVANLLSKYLPQYVDLGFTSSMEKSLDDIADGDLEWVKYLKSVYFGDKGLKNQVAMQEDKIDPEEARSMSFDELKGLDFRVGRYGAYVCRFKDGAEQCASLPEAQAPADISAEICNKLIDQKINGTDALGKDPATGMPVYVLTGRYGPYVQLGDVTDEAVKPKRVSIPAGFEPDQVSIVQALKFLELPKTLGVHPGTGKDVKVGLGRFGPYIVCDGDFRSIPKTDNIFEIELPRALEVLAQPKKGRGRAAPLKELGMRPGTEDAISVLSGKYGLYIKSGKINVSLPDEMKPEDVTLEIALELLDAKEGSTPAGKKAKKAAAKAISVAAKAASAASKAADKVASKSAGKKPPTKAPLAKTKTPAKAPNKVLASKAPPAGKTAVAKAAPAKAQAAAGKIASATAGGGQTVHRLPPSAAAVAAAEARKAAAAAQAKTPLKPSVKPAKKTHSVGKSSKI
jgi:DNA topoisomerase-1